MTAIMVTGYAMLFTLIANDNGTASTTLVLFV
jgi:hypothetical protein